MAAAAAVVVATWESDVHPEFRAALLAAAVEPASPPTITTAFAAPRRPSRRFALELGAALSGGLAPSASALEPAVGGVVVGSATPAGGRLGLRLALAAGTERETPLGTGRVSWRRISAALGPNLRLGRAASPSVDLHAEVLAAALTATGSDFANDRSSDSLDPGVGAGIRGLLLGHALAPWLDVSASGWLREQRAFVTPDGTSVALPRLEVTVAVGLSLFTNR